jgi:hypothetical protein
MEDGVAALDAASDGGLVPEVPGDELAADVSKRSRLFGRPDQDHDLVAPIPQPTGEMSADESSGSGDERPHVGDSSAERTDYGIPGSA